MDSLNLPTGIPPRTEQRTGTGIRAQSAPTILRSSRPLFTTLPRRRVTGAGSITRLSTRATVGTCRSRTTRVRSLGSLPGREDRQRTRRCRCRLHTLLCRFCCREVSQSRSPRPNLTTGGCHHLWLAELCHRFSCVTTSWLPFCRKCKILLLLLACHEHSWQAGLRCEAKAFCIS